jgi:hypothetical protein
MRPVYARSVPDGTCHLRRGLGRPFLCGATTESARAIFGITFDAPRPDRPEASRLGQFGPTDGATVAILNGRARRYAGGTAATPFTVKWVPAGVATYHTPGRAHRVAGDDVLVLNGSGTGGGAVALPLPAAVRSLPAAVRSSLRRATLRLHAEAAAGACSGAPGVERPADCRGRRCRRLREPECLHAALYRGGRRESGPLPEGAQMATPGKTAACGSPTL